MHVLHSIFRSTAVKVGSLIVAKYGFTFYYSFQLQKFLDSLIAQFCFTLFVAYLTDLTDNQVLH